MKRILCFFLTLTLLLVIPPVRIRIHSADGTFSDVSERDWFYESVQKVCALSLMIGTSDTAFSPAQSITGAEAVTLLARLHAAETEGEAALSEATAAAPTPWYLGYMNYCTEKGLLSDRALEIMYDSCSFPLTRAELLYLFSALPDTMWERRNIVPDGIIPDVMEGAFYEAAAYKAYRAGVVVGVDDNGAFRPDASVSRAEVAAILVRLTDPEMRLDFSFEIPPEPETVTLYAADGKTVTVPYEAREDYLWQGYMTIPYTGTFSASALLDAAPLKPTKTGYAPLDAMVDRVFAKVVRDDMTTSQKVYALYDYLVKNGVYKRSPVSGAHRAAYRPNPYISPAPDRVIKRSPNLTDTGYHYYFIALEAHALEGYTAMYAAEMLDGMAGLCDHYSSAFVILMRRLGLPAYPVYINSRMGDIFLPHMTSVVTVGGVDCVFDPQIEQVLVKNTGKNEHKRFCRPIADMTNEYRNWDHLEDCRALMGRFEKQ